MAFNSRLFFWLIKAYFKRWGKLIGIYFICGLVAFFAFGYGITTFAPHIPLIHRTNIGIVGNVSEESIPSVILEQVSHGLTRLDSTGAVKPDLAESWEIQNNGKIYVFHLRKNIHFSDGSILTSKNIHIPFSDVTITTPNDTTLVLTLKDSYAPLLAKLSTPLFKTDSRFVGTGDYEMKDIKENGTFVTQITLSSIKNPYALTTYDFYPTQEALKLALVIGDVDEIVGLKDTSFKNKDLTTFPTFITKKSTDYSQLVTLFFNTTDSNLSDIRLRSALALTLPDDFTQGDLAISVYPPTSFVFSLAHPQLRDLDTGTKFFTDTKASTLGLTLTTTPGYEAVAKQLTARWAQLGVHVRIEVVTVLPDTFQMYLGSFNEGKDPDQYTLWHSQEDNNISRLDNKRIDLLLEEGRKTTDVSQRIQLYTDLQRYLVDEVPAAFLYFPYVYDISRK